MGRKLRSLFKSITPRPGTGERPLMPAESAIMPVSPPADAVVEVAPSASGGPKTESTHDAIARLAYERWLQTGGSEIENWAWAEAEYARMTQ